MLDSIGLGKAAIAINDVKLIHLECKLRLMLILDDISCDYVSYALIPLRSFRTYGIKWLIYANATDYFIALICRYRQTKRLVIYCTTQL